MRWLSTMLPMRSAARKSGVAPPAHAVPSVSVHRIRPYFTHRLVSRNICARSASLLAQPDAATATGGAAPRHELLQWAVLNGCPIHPSLVVTDDAPCGCRGVIAASDITSSWWMSQHPLWNALLEGPDSTPPLIAVREELCMTTEDALQLLARAIAAADPTAVITKTSVDSTADAAVTPAAGPDVLLLQAFRSFGQLLGLNPLGKQHMLQQRLQQLQPPMLLALLLAHQRRLGPQSFWYPYISNLPNRPPCAWYDIVEHAALHGSLPNLSGPCTTATAPATPQEALHLDALQAAASAVAAKCAAAADMFGMALGGITAAEVAWAYGQVASRAFATSGASGTSGLALLPVIDMLNHAAGAAVPVCVLTQEADGHEQQGVPGASTSSGASGGGYWCVWHQQLPDWGQREVVTADANSTTTTSSSSSIGVHEAMHESEGLSEGVSERHSAGEMPADDSVILAAGEELYISYMSSCDAAAALLSFGFVPPELL